MNKRIKVNFSPWTNFGDSCVPYIFTKLDVPFIFAHHTVHKKLLTIGSILGVGNRSDTIVWGTGIVDDKTKALPDAHYLAVRGPRTLQKLVDAGVDISDVKMGDPAMLLPKVYTPSTEKKYKLGITPHMRDYDIVRRHVMENTQNFPNTIVIDTNVNTKHGKIDNFIKTVNSCEMILSTCLHGIICAHAYGIPAAWMKVSNNLAGDDIKFRDHFESVDLPLQCFNLVDTEDVDINKAPHSFDYDALWMCRPWLNAHDDYYVDIDDPDWASQCYFDGYKDKIWIDKDFF